MKRISFRLLIWTLLPALLVLAMALPVAGQAPHDSQQIDPTATLTATATIATAGLNLTAVQPNLVSNAAATELVVTGNGFANGAVVILAGYGALETTFVSSNLLRALLPAEAPPGTYTVSVINPDATSASLANALTVTAPAATPGPSPTPEPSPTPPPTPFIRPLLVVQSYGASSAAITPGENLDFEMTLANAGQTTATNIIATFVTGNFVPRATGGVRAVEPLAPGQTSRFWQPLAASRDLAGQSVGILEVQVAYTDVNGTAYSEAFSLTFPVVRQPAGVAPTPTPTPTPTVTPTASPRLRPQLIITEYQIDVEQLEPGTRFTLQMDVRNLGNAAARRVTMVVGGGVTPGSVVDGTPQPGGGLSGAGGEFSTFAPVGASNVSFLGDLAIAETLVAEQRLIVNAATDPGAYPIAISFIYNDAQDTTFVDEQVITLLVYQRPLLEINFYTEPPPFFAGQPGPLPLQVLNIGNTSTILGNFRASATGAQLMNNNVFVGALEPGGFFPLDAIIIPEQPGPLEVLASVGYTDDFNQPQVVTQTLTLEVMEAPIFEEPIEGGPGPFEPPPQQPETFWQRLQRFILGLLGLSSGTPQSQPAGWEGFPPPGDVPFREGPIDVAP